MTNITQYGSVTIYDDAIHISDFVINDDELFDDSARNGYSMTGIVSIEILIWAKYRIELELEKARRSKNGILRGG